MTQSEPWYIHAGLYAVIVILVVVLIKVAILDPKDVVQQEKFNRKESRLRMTNLKEAEILYQKKYGRFTDNLDTLINFVKYDPMVDSIKNAVDSLTRRPANPFVPLSHGEFNPDSLFKTPKSQQRYLVQIDSSVQVDTVINPRGRVIRVDTTLAIGARYYIEDPDGYGKIGSLESDALKNSPSWE
jgi:hypothetical protein